MPPDPAVQEGRSTHTLDGGKASCLAGALVPTLEEDAVAEHQPPIECSHKMVIEEDVKREAQENVGISPVEAKVENGQLLGVPADASLASKPPYVRIGKNDTDVDEQKVPRARHLRKYQNVKSGQSPRTIPKPKYDADSFEDPLCDEFWEDIWVACAMHNVSVYRFPELRLSPIDKCHFRLRSSVVFFASCQTTWSQHGSITKTSSHITSVFSSQYASRSYSDCPLLRTGHQLEDDLSPEPLTQVPFTGRVERTSDEQGPRLEPRGEDASTNLHSAKTLEETPAHLTNGHTRYGTPKHEKSATEKSTGPQAGEKTSGSMPTEKVNGSAIHDKGKRTRGEPPFTKQEREEMEVLLDDLCGHLGQSSRIQLLCRCLLTRSINSYISNPILGKRRRREQLLVQH